MEETRQHSIVRQRLRGFGYHLAAYFVTMALLVPFNLLTDPNSPWFVLPLVGWGGVMAAVGGGPKELRMGGRTAHTHAVLWRFPSTERSAYRHRRRRWCRYRLQLPTSTSTPPCCCGAAQNILGCANSATEEARLPPV